MSPKYWTQKQDRKMMEGGELRTEASQTKLVKEKLSDGEN